MLQNVVKCPASCNLICNKRYVTHTYKGFYETRNKQHNIEEYDDFIFLYFLTFRCVSFFDQTSQL